MYLKYVLVSCIMSISVVSLLIVPAVRVKSVKSRTQIFSSSLGIIIFICVKSIFTDCGWGFAAIFGVISGFMAQLAMTLGAFVFFRELCISDFKDKGDVVARNTALICFGVGRNLICDYSALSDISLYIFGEAAEFAVIILAMLMLDEDYKFGGVIGLTESAAGIIVIKAVICVILRLRGGFDSEFAALVMITVGISGMVYEFVRMLRLHHSISVGGFAAGFMAALCITTLLG